MLAGPVAIGDVKTLVQELEHLRQNDACLYIVKPSASSEDRQDKEQDQNENNIADCNKSWAFCVNDAVRNTTWSANGF